MVRIQEKKQAHLELSDMGENRDRSAKFSKSCIIFSLLFNARCDFFFGCVNLMWLLINFRLRLKSSNSCTGLLMSITFLLKEITQVKGTLTPSTCRDMLQYLAIWLYLSYR